MKLPLPGPWVDVIGKNMIVIEDQGGVVCLIVVDGVQAAVQVLLDSIKWPLPGPCFDLTA